MTGLLHKGGGGWGGGSQIMTVDDRGRGCLAYLVSPDDVISGQPLSHFQNTKTFHYSWGRSTKSYLTFRI